MGESMQAKYVDQLRALKMNSKPLINSLTMLAADYIDNAPTIVNLIEKHLSRVKQDCKLPALYLIDSILKNVKEQYVTLFARNIVSNFVATFEKADVDTKTQLHKLRLTWKEVFPASKLHELDVLCNKLDKNWCIGKGDSGNPNPASIHVNPKFLGKNPDEPKRISAIKMEKSEAEIMREKVLNKERELLELKQRKLELEIIQAKTLLVEQELQEQERERETKLQTDLTLQKLQQQKALLLQAEKAKLQTSKATQLISRNSVTPPSEVTSINVHDPRLARQMERRNSPSQPISTPSSVGTNEFSLPVTSDRRRRTATDGPSFDTSRLNQVAIKEKSPTIGKSSDQELSSSQSSSGSKSSHSESEKITEIDMFDVKAKKEKRSPGKRSSSRESSRSEKRDKGERKTRRRHSSRESDRSATSKSSSKSSSKKRSDRENSSKKRKHESDEEEDESKGICLLTIKPKRRDLSPELESSHPEPIKRSTSPPEKTRISSSPIKKLKEKAVSSDTSSCDTPTSPFKKRRRSPINSKKSSRDEPSESEKLFGKNYMERKSAVLKRNYRKKTEVGKMEEQEEVCITRQSILDPTPLSGDTDLRFGSGFETISDLDLRTSSSGGPTPSSLDESSVKKSRPLGSSNTNIMDDLFGGEDVDLRQTAGGSSGTSWSQMKVKTRGRHSSSTEMMGDEDIRDILRNEKQNRPPAPISPASSVGSVRCDPLGRPLLYNRLPDDPEERKRSLDSRSTSIDSVGVFKEQFIEPALRSGGNFDVKELLLQAQKQLENKSLNNDEYIAVVKQIIHIDETNKIREVQQLQQGQWKPANTPATGANPWSDGSASNNLWATGSAAPAVGAVTPFTPRFPVPGTVNPPSANDAWAAPNILGAGLGWENPRPAPPGPNPFVEAALVVDDAIPVVNEMELKMAESDTPNSIPIDKVMRQVRFYGETGVVLMGMMADEPKEIFFQKEDIPRPRTVMINGKPLECRIGETRWFDLNRQKHKLKLGAPTRELYLDDRPYELCFGGPSLRINVDGRQHVFQLKGPPPQVEIGKKTRHDLVAGRVNLMLDAVNSITVYLDEKPQKIDLFGFPIVLRFGDGFHTVFLNGRPFPTNFGARLPFTVTTPSGRKHYLRFSALSPSTEKAMMYFIKAKSNRASETNNFQAGPGHFRGGGRGPMPSMMRGQNNNNMRGRGRGFMHQPQPFGIRPGTGLLPDPPVVPMPPVMNRFSFEENPLDVLGNILPSAGDNNNRFNKNQSMNNGGLRTDGNNLENTATSSTESSKAGSSSTASINVSELLAKLMQHGMLPPVKKDDNKDEKKEDTGEKSEKASISDEPKKEDEEEKDEKKTEEIALVEVVEITFNDNLKERRDKLVEIIWTGVQCATCGLRFAADQTLRYSQHLDWHFRLNRREKAHSRKAQNRKWYYDLSDWIQFEEIEDLEERAASMFEHPEDEGGKSPILPTELPSVLASNHEGAVCPQCSETFESYFDEENEEWRLRDCLLDEIEGESKLYHSACHEDYMKSLVEESIVEEVEKEYITEGQSENPEEEVVTMDTETSTTTGAEKDAENKPPEEDDDDDEVLILKEGKKEVVVMEIDVEDDGGENNVLEKNNDDNNEKRNNDLNSEKNESINTLPCNTNNNSSNSSTVNEKNDSQAHNTIVTREIHELNDDTENSLPGMSVDPDVEMTEVGGTPGGIFSIPLRTRETAVETTSSNSIGSSNNGRSFFDDLPSYSLLPMKFDFPPIKMEPLDPPGEEEEETGIDSLEHLKESTVVSAPAVETSHAIDIDLTTDDTSMDEVDSGINRTEIDGNSAIEPTTQLPLKTTKLRINLTGVDSGSPRSSPKPSQDDESTNDGVPASTEEKSSEAGTSDSVIKTGEEKLAEELKLYKPRLVGRKLINCPPKHTGKEESGLCVIC